MTTSGAVSQTVFRTSKVIDHAFRRCKLLPEQIGAEQIATAQDCLYLLLSSLPNKGVQLWCIEKVLVPVYQGLASVDMPVGTNDISGLPNLRNMSRPEGTNTSSAGGTVANAFDDDFDTICTQTSSAGNIQTEFDEATLITTVGYLPGATGALTLLVERSTDGATWTTVRSIASATYTDNEWAWFDLDGAIEDVYWRVRATAGTIIVRELFWGNTPNEVPMARISEDSYITLPNKTFPGQPLQFWLDRQRDVPIMRMWPVCDLEHRYNVIVAWRQRYIEDVGTLSQTLDIPQRWYEAVITLLAAAMASELPEVNSERELILKREAAAVLLDAQNEERDDSPLMVTPMIGAYTA